MAELTITKEPRTFPAPKAAGGKTYTLDELDWLSRNEVESPELVEWIEKVLGAENKKFLTKLMADPEADPRFADELPAAVVTMPSLSSTGFMVGALTRRGRTFHPGSGWSSEPLTADADADAEGSEPVPCSASELAYIFRAFEEGATEVWMQSDAPKAWLDGVAVLSSGEMVAAADEDGKKKPEKKSKADKAEDKKEGTEEVPEGAAVVAIVDELDRTAVIELLAVVGGPTVWRRNDGVWRKDDDWLNQLKSVNPPPMVKLEDPKQIDKVVTAVDKSTEGEVFETSEDRLEEKQKALKGSSGYVNLQLAVLEAPLADEEKLSAMVAAPRPKGVIGAERLRRYWLSGKGAAKIRWGTRHDWTRCVRQLRKYLGPRAKGYCALLHARKLGYWPRGPQIPNPAVKAYAIGRQFSASGAVQPMVAVAADYVPGANPNDLSPAEMEQRKLAGQASADARRKNKVDEAERVRNSATKNVAAHKARVDHYLTVQGQLAKERIRTELHDPALTNRERQRLEAKLEDVYATEAALAERRIAETHKLKALLKYHTSQMQRAAKRYDSASWARAKAEVDRITTELGEEELAGKLLSEKRRAQKEVLAEWERERKAVEAAEKKRLAELKAFYKELERQKKERQRAAEAARKKAESAAKKRSTAAKKKKSSSGTKSRSSGRSSSKSKDYQATATLTAAQKKYLEEARRRRKRVWG